MEQQKTRMSMDQVPFDKLEKVGINRDLIQKMEKQEMTDFLNGFRSDKLYTVNAKIGGEDFKIPARIRLQSKEDGSVDIKVHPIQRLNIPDEYMGHKFSKEEKGALLNDKNLGKTVELTPKIGERGPFYLSIDSKTNELIPLRTSYIQIPDKIKGATLSAEQKENLAAGKKVTVEGMTSKDDKKFSAALQIDAASRKIGFSDFKNEKLNKSEEAKQDKQEGKNQGAKQKVG
jgi:primosomal replication protein N